MSGIRIILTLFFLVSTITFVKGLEIREGVYEGVPHFIIHTRTATYYFDKAGGGISRMIDRFGNDWINFKREPWGKVPESAASAFRGIPNAVFQGEDGGCGHPGFGECVSIRYGPNAILSISKSGKWEWRWNFYEDYACWEVLKTDTARNFWLLYEGPVGGSYCPKLSYWGNSTEGPMNNLPDHLGNEHISGNWQWVYFGRYDRKTTLFIAQENKDDLEDYFSYMGNSQEGIKAKDGMVVFGFGRSFNNKPLLHENNRYILGFWSSKVRNIKQHHIIQNFILDKLKAIGNDPS